MSILSAMRSSKKIGLSVISAGIIISQAFVGNAFASGSFYAVYQANGALNDWSLYPFSLPHSDLHLAIQGIGCKHADSSYNGSFIFSQLTGDLQTVAVDVTGIPNNSTITKIQIQPCAGFHQAGFNASKLAVFYRWNGVNGPLSSDYNLFFDPVPTLQATTTFSGLTLSKTSNHDILGIGVMNTDNGDEGIDVSVLSAKITYTTP